MKNRYFSVVYSDLLNGSCLESDFALDAWNKSCSRYEWHPLSSKEENLKFKAERQLTMVEWRFKENEVMSYELKASTRNFIEGYSQLPLESYAALNRAVALVLYNDEKRKFVRPRLSAAHGGWLRKQIKESLLPRLPEFISHRTASLSLAVSTGSIVASLLEKPQPEVSKELEALHSLLEYYEISLS